MLTFGFEQALLLPAEVKEEACTREDEKRSCLGCKYLSAPFVRLQAAKLTDRPRSLPKKEDGYTACTPTVALSRSPPGMVFFCEYTRLPLVSSPLCDLMSTTDLEARARGTKDTHVGRSSDEHARS